MRVLIAGDSWPDASSGGLNTYVYGLSTELAAREVKQTILSLERSKQDRRPNDAVIVGNINDPFMTRVLRFTWAIIRQIRHHELFVFHFAPYAFALLLMPLRRKAVVMHFHGPWGEEARQMGGSTAATRMKTAYEKVLLRKVDHFIVLSDSFSRLLQINFGISESRISVVRPGGSETFDSKAPLPLEVKNQFLSVRRLVPRMGIDTLIDAWGIAGLTDWRLKILGDGPERERLQDRAMKKGLANIEFLGRVPDAVLRHELAMSYATVVPSMALEGFGLAAIESLSSGTPVIASNLGGLREQLEPLRADLLVEPGRVDLLAEKLQQMGRGLLRIDRDMCREYARTFTWSKCAQEVHVVYEHVATRRLNEGYKSYDA